MAKSGISLDVVINRMDAKDARGLTTMGQIPDAAVGAVVASLIAGTVSLLGLIISKEQKTSEFRQAWIDALRTDLTLFLTQINAINDAIKIKYNDDAMKNTKLSPLYMNLNTSHFNILLRVNPKEKNSRNLLNAVANFGALMRDESLVIPENLRPIESEFLNASQTLLKFEWNRVKSGEISFRIAKLLALFVIINSFIFGGTILYRNLGGGDSRIGQRADIQAIVAESRRSESAKRAHPGPD